MKMSNDFQQDGACCFVLFELPNNNEAVLKVIQAALSNNFKQMRSQLFAPKDAENAAKKTGIRFERFYNIHNSIIDGLNEFTVTDELAEIVLGEKLPAFVKFSDIGSDGCMGSDIPIDKAGEIICRFIKKGYSGSITLWSDYGEFTRIECNFQLQPWTAVHSVAVTKELEKNPPRVRIEWYPSNKGEIKDVEKIIKICKSLGLHSYKVPGKSHSEI
jgi:hypothetical protein